jgi:hypothetical protein
MLCPSDNFLDNNNPFSHSAQDCRYHTLEGTSAASTPKASIRVRKPDIILANKNKYLRYSVLDPETEQFVSNTALNLNSVPQGEISIFPHDLYRKEPFANNSPYLNPPRDNTLLYTFSPDPLLDGVKERSVHTNFSSRFGYDRFADSSALEYGTGVQVFGYVEPRHCHSCAKDTPKNMAPPRFYNYPNLEESSYTEYRKITGRLPHTFPDLK